MSKIVGIDYSMTCPAICILGDSFRTSGIHFLTPNKKLQAAHMNMYGHIHRDYKTTEERFFNITNWAMVCLPPNLEENKTIVYIEDYSMGSTGPTFSIAENTGLLKHYLYKNNVEFHLISPSVIKKDFTGKGNADKSLMYDAFVERTKIDLFQDLHLIRKTKVDSPISDIVDSYALALLGRKMYNG